jgi:hypothetical protein
MEPEKNTSELAFNASGESFDPPANATGWRPKRMKPRGAPEVPYGPDGRPVLLPIDATMEELREAVGQLGRYRLDPVNEDGKIIDGAQSAYIQVVRPERPVEALVPRAMAATISDDLLRDVLRLNAELARQVARPVTTATDELLRDVVRLNTGLANAVIESFSVVMNSSADILRAADGAGLPARVPRDERSAESDADDDDDEDSGAPAPDSPLFTLLNNLVAKGVPAVVDLLTNKKAPAKIAVPAPAAQQAQTAHASQPAQTAQTLSTTAGTAPSAPSPPPEATFTLPPLDLATMMKIAAVQAALTQDEATLVRALAAELPSAELHALFGELSALTVPEAVAKIRTIIAPPAATTTTPTTTTVGGVS